MTSPWIEDHLARHQIRLTPLGETVTVVLAALVALVWALTMIVGFTTVFSLITEVRP